MKDIVYAKPVLDVQDLRNIITNVISTTTPDMLQRIWFVDWRLSVQQMVHMWKPCNENRTFLESVAAIRIKIYLSVYELLLFNFVTVFCMRPVFIA